MGSNRLSIIIVFILYYVLIFWGTGIGGFFVGGSGYSFMPNLYGILIGLVIGTFLAVIGIRMQERIILKSARATPVNPRKYPELIEAAIEYSRMCCIPLPNLYVTPEILPNFYAFSSKSGMLNIVFTRGFLDLGRPQYYKAAIAWAATGESKGLLRSRTLGSSLAYIFMYPAKIGDLFSIGSMVRYNIMNLIFLLPFAPLAAFLIHMAGGKRGIYEIDHDTTNLTGDQGFLVVTFIEIEKKLTNYIVDMDLALVPLFVAPPKCSNIYYVLFRPFPPIQKRINRLRSHRKHQRSRKTPQ